MNPPTQTHIRTLAIDPCPGGFGFAVVENGDRLVNWGVATLWSKAPDEFLNRLDQIFDAYTPSLLVLEDHMGSKLGKKARRVIDLAAQHAKSRKLSVAMISRKKARAFFREQGRNKYEIAKGIADGFPELRPRVQLSRRAWESERNNMSIFDALALILALSPETMNQNIVS